MAEKNVQNYIYVISKVPSYSLGDVDYKKLKVLELSTLESKDLTNPNDLKSETLEYYEHLENFNLKDGLLDEYNYYLCDLYLSSDIIAYELLDFKTDLKTSIIDIILSLINRYRVEIIKNKFGDKINAFKCIYLFQIEGDQNLFYIVKPISKFHKSSIHVIEDIKNKDQYNKIFEKNQLSGGKRTSKMSKKLKEDKYDKKEEKYKKRIIYEKRGEKYVREKGEYVKLSEYKKKDEKRKSEKK